MAISLKTQKMLWGRAAARCAFPQCRRHLVEDISDTDDPTLVGENCHIVAEKDDGPRGDASVSVENRNRYANLILLCSVDHKIIDDNPSLWTVGKLLQLKREHEGWVEKALGLDAVKLREDTVYADYIEEWERLTHLDAWKDWSSFVLGSGQPRIAADIDRDLDTLRDWLLSRIWPGRYKTLETAFQNFHYVLQDFQETLRSRLEQRRGNEMLFTRKFYQIDDWDPARYERLSAQYEFHVDVVSDLMLELTRAGNLICDEVRKHMLHSYRLKEGNLVVLRGPDMQLRWTQFAPRYTPEQASKVLPYPGLTGFYNVRTDRDWNIGSGTPS